MSRWIDNFNTHAFRAIWEDMKTKLNECEADTSTPTSVQELARLNKVVSYLDNALENIDPELFPTSLLDSFSQQATECRKQINSYISNKNIGHITNANKNADNLLTYIRPYMIHTSSMKKTLLAAVRAYQSEMSSSLEGFQAEVSEILTKISEKKNSVDTYEANAKQEVIEIENIRERVESFEMTLLGDPDDDVSIKEKIEDIEKDFNQKHQNLNALYDETFEDDEDEERLSIKTALIQAKIELEKDANSAEILLKELKVKVANLDEFYDKIFGEANEDKTRENGLKDVLDERLSQLEAYEITQETKHTVLFEKIESLLPGATTAGLATAYKEMKESFDDPISTWNNVFLASLGVMFFATFLSFVHFDGGWSTFKFSFADHEGLKATLDSLLYKLPLYIPLVWLAIFASKRRSEAQRLQQEYAHKEALAKSYDSFKKQIEELEKDDQTMLLKLIESAINTIAHNASETLDGKHGDGTPLHEFMKNASEAKKIFKNG